MQPEEARFYLDECLPLVVAQALRLVGYQITDHRREQKTGWGDEELVPWLAQNGYIWITKDHDAKKAHADAIRRNLLSVVWVRGMDRESPDGRRINTRMLHRMLTNRLDKVSDQLRAAQGPRHFELRMGGNNPRLDRVDEGELRAGAPLPTRRKARRRRRA